MHIYVYIYIYICNKLFIDRYIHIYIYIYIHTYSRNNVNELDRSFSFKIIKNFFQADRPIPWKWEKIGI